MYKIDHSKKNLYEALGIKKEDFMAFREELKTYAEANPDISNSELFEHLINFLRKRILNVDANTTEYEALLFTAGYLLGEATSNAEQRRTSFIRLFGG
jgi:hypothetical protein